MYPPNKTEFKNKHTNIFCITYIPPKDDNFPPRPGNDRKQAGGMAPETGAAYLFP